MAKVSPYQGDFGGGEFSPLLYGRAQADRYKSALAHLRNYIPTTQGGLVRRSGTRYMAPTRQNGKARLIPFEITKTESYMLEINSGGYIRFYLRGAVFYKGTTKTITGITQANPGVVTSNSHGLTAGQEFDASAIVGMTQLNGRRFRVGTTTTNTFQLLNLDGSNFNTTSLSAYVSGGTMKFPYELSQGFIDSPPAYTDSELNEIQFAQSDNILYLVHPNYLPYLIYYDPTNVQGLITGAPFSFRPASSSILDSKPPFVNGPSTFTMTPSAVSGTGVTLTASAAYFVATDVGRYMAIQQSSVWGYAIISGYTSATVVQIDIFSNFASTSASSIWDISAWGATTGYPGTICFHEDRLLFGAIKGYPLRIDASKTGSYKDFTPHGTTASDAFNITLRSKANDGVRWLATDEKGLLAGTRSNEWLIRASSLQEALTASNASAKKSDAWGSDDGQSVQVGKAAIYVQKSGRKVRELTYNYDVDGFKSADMSLLSQHITAGGVSQLCHLKEPQSIVWMVRADGALVGMTYERTEDGLRVGWHSHFIGGASDAAGSTAIVESIQVMPSDDGSRSDLWLVVQRYVNGMVVRQTELLTKMFEDTDEQRQGFFVDCGLSYDQPKAITGITQGNPAVVTVAAHGYSNGDQVYLSNIKGMRQMNGRRATIANATTNTFELTGVDASAFSPYVSAGVVRKYVGTISGLWHLEGQTVSVCVDGAAHPNVVVTGGAITLSNVACTVHVGLPYSSDGKMLRMDVGAADGTAIGKTQRTHRVGFMLHRTLGFKFGMSFKSLQEIIFRSASDQMGAAVPLFSGIKSEEIEGDYNTENQICWRQDQPLPGILLAIEPQLVTQDR